MKKQFGRLMKTVFAASVAVSFVTPLKAAGKGPEEFDRWMEEEFIETMESDYMSMHFSVRDYRAMGIEKPEAIIGEVGDIEDYADDVKECEDTLAELAEFDYDSLSDTQKHDYDCYKFYVERVKELSSYPMFDFAFQPTGGIIDGLLTNFTEFKFYEKSDFDDYLAVLESSAKYIDDALELTKIQAASGYFLTDSALDQTEEAISRFVGKTDDNELIIIFDKNADAFSGLSDSEKEAYKKRNRDIVLNSFIPAYKKAGEELEKLRGSRSGKGGLSSLKDGREYCEALLRSKSSSMDTPEELLSLCEEYITDNFGVFYLVMTTADQSDMNAEVSFADPEETLKYFQDHLSDVYPEGPEVTFKASYLDPSVSSDGITAYYLNPPIDDIKDNIIKINGGNISNVNDMYQTLAHEGFPGHCYQITWFLNTNPAHLRAAMDFSGYTEGWAMYAEDWAWSISKLKNAAAEIQRLNTGLSYVMNAAVDIGVNALGWGEKEVGKWLGRMGFDSSFAKDLYEFVLDTPCVIIPYGVGLAKFWKLKKGAETTEGFSLKDFNKVLLTYGDRPFEIVKKDVDAYITSLGGTPAEHTPAPSGTDPAVPTDPESGQKWVMIGGGIALAAALLVIFLALKSHKKADRI